VNQFSSNNTALISGPGSVWKVAAYLHVGSGNANRVTISNGASLYSARSYIGFSDVGHNNEVVITGLGSVWTNQSVAVGNAGSGNRLVLTNGALLRSSETVTIGTFSPSAGNRLIVDSATMLVTNAINTGQLMVRGGTNVLNSGFIEVDQLSAPDPLGKFELNAGTFITKSTVYNNGRVFDVGAPGSFGSAVLNLGGNGVHFFANGLSIKSNGTLLGNGTILGTVTVGSLGTLSPGSSIGKLTFNSTPSLAGITAMEISKDGIALTNDQIQVTAPLTYGGSLVVTKLGPTALTSGDRFQLFSAPVYSGSFLSITLPPLSGGLTWTNKLAVDGSIEVLGGPSPRIESIVQSGTNVVMSGTNGPANGTYYVLASTNVALPLTNWTRVLTNQFNGSGNFSCTNPISPALPRRFFILELP
jgi:T5SS/PEP-CTERM-associated repeat protein